MNVFTFTGNLGRDCRTNTVGQHFVCNFSVAVTEGFGDRKKTHWVECALWGKQGEALAPYLLKGAQVCVSGEFGMKEASGDYPAAPACRVSSINLIGGKRDAEPRQESGSRQPPRSEAPVGGGGGAFEDDIPFARRTSNYSF